MRTLVIGIAVACIAVGFAAVAFAVPPSEFLRVKTNQTISGACCFSWGESVSITEPKAVVPVVVTWSTDFRSTNISFVGVALNGHPCISGETLEEANAANGSFTSRTVQWIIQPSDGLIKGSNTITLCGGLEQGTGSISLGFNTLAVRIAK